MAELRETSARITSAYSGYYLFETPDGAAGVARLKKGSFRSRDPEAVPVAGDIVRLQKNPRGESRITAVEPRKTRLVRRDPSGSGRRAQVLAANFDEVFMFAGCDRPFVPGRMERMAALARSSGARTTVVLSKCDLADAAELREMREYAAAAAPGTEIVALSVESGEGVETLAARIGDGTAILLGESGAGKSSFLNRLAGRTVAGTREVREKDAKGRHTTTAREYVKLPRGGAVIDTPGLREVGLWDAAAGLADAFADVEAHLGRCRFSDCRHSGEPGCAVRAAIESGALAPERWESYRRYAAETAARGRERRGGAHKARR